MTPAPDDPCAALRRSEERTQRLERRLLEAVGRANSAEAVCTALRAAFVAEDARNGAEDVAKKERLLELDVMVAEAWRECRAAYEEWARGEGDAWRTSLQPWLGRGAAAQAALAAAAEGAAETQSGPE